MDLTEGTSWEEYYRSHHFIKKKQSCDGIGHLLCRRFDGSDYFTKAIAKRFLADVPIQRAVSGIDSTLLALIAKDFDDGFDTTQSSQAETELEKSKSLCENFRCKR